MNGRKLANACETLAALSSYLVPEQLQTELATQARELEGLAARIREQLRDVVEYGALNGTNNAKTLAGVLREIMRTAQELDRKRATFLELVFGVYKVVERRGGK